MRCADAALRSLRTVSAAALADARALHARGLLLEARARTQGTQENHASRLARLALFGRERFGLNRCAVLPLHGAMDTHLIALFLQSSVAGGTT